MSKLFRTISYNNLEYHQIPLDTVQNTNNLGCYNIKQKKKQTQKPNDDSQSILEVKLQVK